MKIRDLSELLTLNKVRDWELTRFGGKSDGGYLFYEEIASVSDCLYSYGVGRNTTFEVDFCNRTKKQAFAFDHTVKDLPHLHESITFVREGIAGEKRPKMNTFEGHREIYGGKKVLLKIDVEGWEYDVFEKITRSTLKSVTGILLEIHNIHSNFAGFVNLIRFINNQFALIHIHPNNYGEVFVIDGKRFPDVLEMSYVNKEFFDVEKNDIPQVPHKFDIRNSKKREDINISYLYENNI